MLQGELSSEFFLLLFNNFGVIVFLSILFWCALHVLYERGALGSWPPSRLSVRITVWTFLLFPLVIGFGFVGLLLLISIFVPSLELQLIIDFLDFAEYLFLLIFASLVFFRILRYCWRGYGTTGVMIVVCASSSTSLALSSLGLAYNIGYFLIDFGHFGYRGLCILFICWLREAMKIDPEKESDDFAVLSHTHIEVAMKKIYSVLIPLARRIKVSKDEAALRMMQNVLQMDSDFERSLSLASKALGFDRMDLINAPDVENASMVLQGVATNWGNFSKIDLVALILVSVTWIVSGLLTVWAYIGGVIKENLVAVVLFFALPFGALAILSLTNKQSPGREYDLAKRHDEPFRFTQRECSNRRKLDLIVLAITLIGATSVGALIILLGNSSLGYLVFICLFSEYVLSVALIRFDSFMLGRNISDEEMMGILRKKLLSKSVRKSEESGRPSL